MSEYGSSSAGAAAGMAELHLKMSKKIAQLTKVIFHLNTRNEDFQMEFAHLKQVHVLEQQQLTQDAATKLKLMTEQLQSQKDLATQADARAAKEKAQFMKDLTMFQQQAATQQTTTQQEFQRRVQMLEEQVDQSKRAFVDRIQQLTQMAEAQQRTHQSLSASTTATMEAAHRNEMAEWKRKHMDEMEQVVMSSNAKYTQMLAEQLRVHDALKSELANETSKWEQTANNSRQVLETQLQKQQEDAQQRFDEMKHQLVGKMEHLLADAEALRASDAKLRSEKDELLKAQGELQRQIKLLDLQVSKAQHETQSVRKDSDANLQTSQQLLALSTEKIAQLTQEIEVLKKTLAGRDEALQLTMKERDTLQLELLQGSANISERHAQHQQQLNERDLRLANLQAELAMLRQQASVAEAQALKKIQALETSVAEKEKERSELQQKLSSAELLRASLQKDKDKNSTELKTKLDEAEKLTEKLKAEHNNARQELKNAHARELEMLRNSHSSELEALQRDGDKRVEEAKTQLTQHSSASMEKAMSETKQQHAQALAQLKAATEANDAKWTQEKKQLQADVHKLEAQLAQKTKEAAEALAKTAELSAKLKKVEEQLALVSSEKETLLKSTQKTQKERDEAFQKQLKEATGQHDSVVKRLTSEKDRLVVDHKQALLQLLHDHTEKLKKAQNEWDEEKKTQMLSQNAALSAFYEPQLAQLQQQLLKEKEQAEAAACVAAEQRQRLEECRLADFESHHGELIRFAQQALQKQAEMAQNHCQAVEKCEIGQAEALERLTSKHKAEKDELTRSSLHHAEQKRSQLMTQHLAEVESLRQDHALAVRTLQESLQAQRNSEALALRTEMAHKLKELRAQKDRDMERALCEMKATHDALYGALEQNAESLQTTLTQRISDLENARQECEKLRVAVDAKSHELHDRVASLEKTNRDEVDKLKLAAKREMDRLLEENLQETRQLSDQFEETKRLMLDKVAFLKRSIADWEDKYAMRESRPEDVARISSLERAVVERDALVKQTLDEMAYFKRELLNREEMYNKTFARSPNVGVLNVLKPHVQLQAQLQASQNQMTNQIPVPPPHGMQTPQANAKRKTKPVSQQVPEAAAELQRRGSERGTAGTTTKKSLPPLMSTNNQGFGL